MDKHAEAYYQSALALKLPCKVETAIDGFSFYFARKRYFINASCTPFNPGSGENINRNKYAVAQLLLEADIPVPDVISISRKYYLDNPSCLNDLDYPVVVKPTLDGSDGRGVFCNIKNKAMLEAYLKNFFQRYSVASIEKFIPNLKSYRVLVFNRKVIGVLERTPAGVEGDGVSTISELIAKKNEMIGQDKGYPECTGRIVLADEQYEKLREMGMTPSSVPDKGEVVSLSYKCNATMGGTVRTADSEICKQNCDISILAADALSLNLTGIDFLCEDIGKPISTTGGVIIELNYGPAVVIHEYPTEGDRNNVTRKILLGFMRKQHPFFICGIKLKGC